MGSVWWLCSINWGCIGSVWWLCSINWGLYRQCVVATLYMLVRSWFCIVYEAAKPRVDYANQDLTILVPLIVDPLTS